MSTGCAGAIFADHENFSLGDEAITALATCCENVQKPPLDPDVADTAPSDPALTVYDEEHLITYQRLLDADAEGVDWREVARVVLHLDPSDRARGRSRAIYRAPNG